MQVGVLGEEHAEAERRMNPGEGAEESFPSPEDRSEGLEGPRGRTEYLREVTVGAEGEINTHAQGVLKVPGSH